MCVCYIPVPRFRLRSGVDKLYTLAPLLMPLVVRQFKTQKLRIDCWSRDSASGTRPSLRPINLPGEAVRGVDNGCGYY